FLSGKSGSAQVWRANADGSVRPQLTSFPVEAAGFRWAPNDRPLIVVAGVYPDCATLACTKARVDAKAKDKGSAIEIKGSEPRWGHRYIDAQRLGLLRVALAQPGAPSDAAPIVKGFAGDLPPDGDTDALA